jgi:hypothetical protein
MQNLIQAHKILLCEDNFTKAFEQTLNDLPALGQKIVNFIVAGAGKESSKFVKAIDHPRFEGYQCRPDLLIECEKFDIICEHKLQAPLSNGQLESYLEIARNQKKLTYLVLISNCYQLVPSAVPQSLQYLSPNSKSHFRWQDLYSIIADHPERLANDFKVRMEELRMVPPPPIIGWEFLFDGEPKEVEFQVELYRNIVAEALKPYFKIKLRAFCGKDGADRWGYRIKYPHGIDWLHLMYIYARDWDEPSMIATIWIPEHHASLNAFRNVETEFRECGITIYAKRDTPSGELYTPTKDIARAVISYVADLNEILSPDLEKTKRAIEAFAIAVFKHAQQTVMS